MENMMANIKGVTPRIKLRTEKIIELNKQGLTMKQIAFEVECGYNTVTYVLKRAREQL